MVRVAGRAAESASSTCLERLEENLGAADVELTADDRHDIDTAAPTSRCTAPAYPEHLERLTNL
jgi:diketogulonate reductase-like aldo/keto reductase